ncbi:hypothetical protein BYT27DRAFT_6957216 [Phlegmacium glaucopus]|nr:hypothetical protein BYT27DRAFT_6957216 [Phlegmacium glaucopus]
MSPPRIADAANIHPYPFAVRQERLPPDNADRNGKPKKSKPRPRPERNPRQEEEIRFNTGPRNLRGSPANRGGRRPFRMQGRHDRGYDDQIGIPDYPPPSFQEATMTTPPLSACSSTTTLVPASIPTVLIPENIPEMPEFLVVPPKVETLNKTVVSDQGSDSDESLQIIDKSSVVCSDDLPKGVELEKRVRSDWKSRRGFDFPISSSSEFSQKQGDGSDADRGRSARRIPGRLTIDSNVIVIEDNNKLSPISPTKRRFLSLSPLRTILSPPLGIDPDRPVSAQPSPCSSPYATSSRSIFFRSSTSLATASMMKLPLSPCKNDNSANRKLFGKGKEKLDHWEVIDEDNYPDEFDIGGYPSSLMSAIQALKISPSFHVGNSPARSQSFSVGSRPLASPRTKEFPNGSQDGTMHEAQSIVSSQTHLNGSLRDRKGPSSALLDRKLWRSPASASTAASGSVALGAEFPPTRPISPVTHPVPSPTPVPSILKHTLPPIHSSPLRPTIVTGDQPSSTKIDQQALDTPLPATPVYRTHFDVVVNGTTLNDQETIIAARPVPELNDSFSAEDVCTCRSTPLSLGTANSLAQINFMEEPMTPNRRHYTGRPLPRPPPSVTRSNIDSTFAPGVSAYDAEGHSSRCPEGLLINLDDTSLDDCSASGASTPLSDEARLRSQQHLPITPSSSATELTVGSTTALSDSTVRGPTSPMSEANRRLDPTELDLLVSRLADGEGDGSDYEVSSGHPGWQAPSLNNRPDAASGLRANWTRKRDPCPHNVPPTIYLPERQHLTHWANRSQT